MDKLSIKFQSAVSVGVVLSFLAILAAIGYISTISLGGAFTEYRGTARQAVMVNGLAADLFEIRMSALRYRVEPTPAQAESVYGSIQKIQDAREDLETLFASDPQSLATLEAADQQTHSYSAAFREMVALQESREVLVGEAGSLGEAARESIAALLGDTISKLNGDTTGKLVKTEESLLLGRLYFEKFLLTNGEAELTTARQNLGESQSALSSISESPFAGVSKSQITEIGTEIDSYIASVDQVAGIIAKQNGIRENTLDVLGRQMQDTYLTVVDKIVARQDVLGPAGAATVSNTKWFGLIFSIVAVILGAGIAFFLSNRISASVEKMAAVMDEMSEGNYEIEVKGAEHQNEIGMMARALEKFKEAANERIRLEQENAEGRKHADEAQREREQVSESLTRAVDLLGDGLTRLAEGDLTVKLEEPFIESIDQLRLNFNASVEKLQQTMTEIRTNTVSIDESANEMQTAVDELSKRTEQQAASLEETSAALEQVTATVKSTSERSDEASEMATTARGSAEESGKVVASAIEAMGRIEGASSEISNIINVIDEIAFQTNLLALNAGVEAARAGDAGKGFAVVAQEVRELAQRSAGAAKDIKALITKSGEEVGSGVELVTATGAALDTITGHVNEIASHIESIATAAKEQSSGLQEINMAVNQMDQTTQNNAAMVEEATAVTHRVGEDVRSLSGQVGQFNVGSVSELAAVAQAATEQPTPVADKTPPKPARHATPVVDGNTALKADDWDEF